MTFGNRFAVHFCTLDSRYIQWAGQIVNDCIQQRLNTLVFERGTAQNWVKVLGDCTLANQFLDCFDIWFFAFHIGFHNVIVQCDNFFNQFVVQFFGFFAQFFGNFFDMWVFAQVIFPYNGTHFNDINNTAEIRFGADWEIHNQWVCAQTFTNHINTAEEVSTNTIHFVNKANTRNIITVCLAPYGFGLGLNTGHRFKHCDRAVQNAQRAFHFHCKVNVSRGINQIDAVVTPKACCCRRCNCDTTFLFLFHPVHRRATIVNFADFICFSCIEKNTF